MPDHTQKPLVRFDRIAVRLGGRLILEDTSWEIRSGQHWAVTGPNGAGKSSLVRALAGDLPIVRGRVMRHASSSSERWTGYVSFELQRHLIAQEEKRDHARFFSGNTACLTTVRQTIDPENRLPERIGPIALRLGIRHLLDRPLRVISTGEMRKTLIARAMIRAPRLLILDEPFDGLDIPSREQLKEAITGLMNGHVQVILVTHRPEEIPAPVSHVICLEEGRVVRQGRLADLPEVADRKKSPAPEKPVTYSLPSGIREIGPPAPGATSPILVEMKDVTVRYGENRVLTGLSWTVRQGENWAITGPNGSGKTTLLRLIAGDHPQAYANEIWLFGRKRGSGESIWEIREHIGLVSSEFQVRYRKPLSATDVVLSGFFDSVGLYRHATAGQRETAAQWIRLLGIDSRAERRFDRLSYGEQRMVLLARAMVKLPTLLILDEPCQGLDHANRQRVLSLIDLIGQNTRTRMLYVTHYADEIPTCTTHRLRLRPGGAVISEQNFLHTFPHKAWERRL